MGVCPRRVGDLRPPPDAGRLLCTHQTRPAALRSSQIGQRLTIKRADRRARGRRSPPAGATHVTGPPAEGVASLQK